MYQQKKVGCAPSVVHVSGCKSALNHFLNFRMKLLLPEMRTSDWLLMCLFAVSCDQRDHLSLPLM